MSWDWSCAAAGPGSRARDCAGLSSRAEVAASAPPERAPGTAGVRGCATMLVAQGLSLGEEGSRRLLPLFNHLLLPLWLEGPDCCSSKSRKAQCWECGIAWLFVY